MIGIWYSMVPLTMPHYSRLSFTGLDLAPENAPKSTEADKPNSIPNNNRE